MYYRLTTKANKLICCFDDAQEAQEAALDLTDRGFEVMVIHSEELPETTIEDNIISSDAFYYDGNIDKYVSRSDGSAQG